MRKTGMRARVFARRSGVDWLSVIQDLERTGLSDFEISNRLGIPRSTLMGFKNGGVEPRYCDGERLLALWHERVNVEKPTPGQCDTEPSQP